MGGIGSGTWYRWNTKTTVEDCKKLDIRLMARKGWLKPGWSGSLNWTRNGEPWGDINCRSYHDRLILNYRFRTNGEDWQPVTEEIYFGSSECNYGGQRKWFICPGCGQRCAILCSAGKLFLCRKCYNLPYESQLKGVLDRLIAKKHKFGYRIFEDYSGFGYRKRKGMHQCTFNRLLEKYQLLEIKVDELVYVISKRI